MICDTGIKKLDVKTTTLFIVFQFIGLALSAQTLFDMYLMLPEKVGPVDKLTRELMINNYKIGNKNIDTTTSYRFDKVDEDNGFLGITKGDINNEDEAAWSDMCYWNLKKKKLIAISFVECDPACDMIQFKFFILKNNKLYEQSIDDIIPGYNTIYDDFIKDEKTRDRISKMDISNAGILFDLPREGKDIIVSYYSDADTPEFIKGNRMLLKWQNGKFIKDKIFWGE